MLRKLSSNQWIGIGLGALGVVLVVLSLTYSSTCPDFALDEQADARQPSTAEAPVAEQSQLQEDYDTQLRGDAGVGCNQSKASWLFYLGVACILLFCCVPSFAIGAPKPFYQAFPALKGHLGTRRGTRDVHIESLSKVQTL
eukprot:m.123993 g.123993  ORF g.123993 m.123993 type:complete len:141 (-) comp13765_c0_seq1:354-776(-)